jgi:hypothetical protein
MPVLNTLKTLFLALLVTTNALAQSVQKLDKGTPAPFSGWLITEKVAETSARNVDLLEAKEKQILKLEHLRVLDAGDMEHYKQRSKDLQKQLHKQETKQYWTNAGAFALGVLLTGLAAKAAIESTK